MPFPIDITYIHEAETRLGAKFPIDYVEFMCKLNGGEFILDDEDWILYPIADKSDRKRIARTASNVEVETASWHTWEGTPSGAICIADNQMGDKLVLLRDGDHFLPGIYRWDHNSREFNLAIERIQDIERE